ncbi:MAG: exodeoxyribonuclease VII large subunit, partial [Candidatus Moranbacteria bacterium]|nr:exodeoxyribonuclease VII large subunit [Candidatus Moranbacteria bacterium]
RRPTTPDELMEVKGIKDAKCRQYGKEILEIVGRSGAGSGHLSFPGASYSTRLPFEGEGQGGDEEKLAFRKKLRNEATPQEVVLWSRLRNEQLGCKFRRQHPIGEYIVDYCCIEKKLVVEVDGSQHIVNQFSDGKRTDFLRARGYSVLRFWNNDIDRNIDGVMLKIQEALGGILPLYPPPSEGGEVGTGVFSGEDDGARLLFEGEGQGGEEEKPLSVGQFLNGLNTELSGMAARVRGEVSSVDERDRVVYFSIKDAADDSMLNCLIFRWQYDVSGVRLREGDEIIVEGVPEIWKPMGKLSFKVGTIEVAGEGALKRAYDELYRKLESEGAFAPERKRPLPEFPERIALITSEQGAAIGDFLTNVGSLGIRIDLYPSSVEGKRAVLELLRAIRAVRKRRNSYDLLVIVRGGGSIESLQAFNTESLVREVDACEIPVIAGIGHEKDISLAALAADRMVSTPTAAARTIREPFERARQTLGHHERIVLSSYEDALRMTSDRLESGVTIFLEFLDGISMRFERAASALRSAFGVLSYRIRSDSERIDRLSSGVVGGFRSATRTTHDRIDRLESALRTYDPNRVLSLGYGLIRAANGILLRKSTDTRVGDRLDIRLSEGRIGAEVKEVE